MKISNRMRVVGAMTPVAAVIAQPVRAQDSIPERESWPTDGWESTDPQSQGMPADLVVEIDDYLTHGDRLAFERDRRKQNRYLLAGVHTLRITEATLPRAVEAVRALTTSGSPGRSR